MNHGCGKKPCTNIEVKPISELPIERNSRIPDNFLIVQTKINPNDGNVMYVPELIPGNAVLPNGPNANAFLLYANNDSLVIPENGVLPCYVENTGVHNVVLPADANHPAHFLVTGVVGDKLRCQACGPLEILAGHKYNIGVPYYRSSKAGEVTTDPSQTGQRLFYPVSEYQISCEFTW